MSSHGIEETNNVLNEHGDGYEHVYEYIPIAQPNATTLTKLDALRPTSVCGDRQSFISLRLL
jgi:ATP-dependent DNA helicase 2 subunit 2